MIEYSIFLVELLERIIMGCKKYKVSFNSILITAMKNQNITLEGEQNESKH
jgi:hypothetical protein